MKKLFVLILLGFLLYVGCEKFARHSYSIRIVNNSQQTISVYASYIYPDTSLAVTKPNFKDALPQKFLHIYDSEVNDPKFERLLTEKITIFILSKDTLAKYSWNEIITSYNILKRVEINNSDLKNMGWEIVYK